MATRERERKGLKERRGKIATATEEPDKLGPYTETYSFYSTHYVGLIDRPNIKQSMMGGMFVGNAKRTYTDSKAPWGEQGK
ncbi:hypothetical protein OsI_03293 [Oryza sativa Indica Group]|uniref:Uncharacterized protein n=1 Tax=Oryza sativa subsp. indica TaxID=39946 RepID=A2WTU6_ORYSI|nr:hypothetical protein OsI_03293 [Oryza sativa Indica Group]